MSLALNRDESLDLPDRLRRVARNLGWVGIVAVAVSAIIAYFDPKAFFPGYLAAFVFWVEIAFGCLAMLCVQNLTGGRWGVGAGRLFEAGMMTIPFCALLFLPILLGLPYLYSWLHPYNLAFRHLVEDKAFFLNVPAFILRNFLYFSITGGLALYLRWVGRCQDAGDPLATERMTAISGPALVILVLLMNFAVIDWVMSLRPEWYSSMLVVEFVTQQGVAALAWTILILRFVSPFSPLSGVINEKVIHDLGKLLLASISFWAYVTFGEYLIVWTGNLPHEISWFLKRSTPGWAAWAVLLVALHFVVPLFFLIMTSVTKRLDRLARVAGLLLVAHFVQIVWWIEPGFTDHFRINYLTPVLIGAMGCLWVAAYLRNLAAAPLIARHDLRLASLDVARPAEVPT